MGLSSAAGGSRLVELVEVDVEREQPIAPGRPVWRRWRAGLGFAMLAIAACAGPLLQPAATSPSGPAATALPTMAAATTATTAGRPAPSPTAPAGPFPVATPTAAHSWASLGAVQPLWLDYSAGLAGGLFADPADPRRLAYCAPAAIYRSLDGGASWSAIPTTGVAGAAAATGYSLPRIGSEQAAPPCRFAVLDPDHSQSIYAVFATVQQPQDAPPPEFLGGFFTSDGGQTWQPVPVPPETTMGQFGGFRLAGHAVQALFRTAPPAVAGPGAPATLQVPLPIVEQTSDGGVTWVVASLACPPAGPCVTWGSLPSGIGSCAMHGYDQTLYFSPDGGRTWASPDWPRGANACNPNQLAALSPSMVVLASGGIEEGGAFPLRLSLDGGRTWQAVGLPPLPPPATPGVFLGLQLLPDGRLLATDGHTVWYLLAPGMSQWCRAIPGTLPASTRIVQVAGDQLWWLEATRDRGAGNDARPVPHNLSLADLACSASS